MISSISVVSLYFRFHGAILKNSKRIKPLLFPRFSGFLRLWGKQPRLQYITRWCSNLLISQSRRWQSLRRRSSLGSKLRSHYKVIKIARGAPHNPNDIVIKQCARSS